jgi:multidrug efflux pump subunit AcrB
MLLGVLVLVFEDLKLNSAGASSGEGLTLAMCQLRSLRPIAMTALATVAGMLPLALAIGSGSEMIQPLAIAVIGGLLSSMVLSLVFTPAIHYFLQTGN